MTNDPALNAVIIVMCACLALAALIAGAFFLVPIALLVGVGKGIHWYVNRPPPTYKIYEAAEANSARAAFPEPEKFLEAHFDRLFETWGDDLPAYGVYQSIAGIADELYKSEDLANTLPPLPPAVENTIEEGRYRDRLLARMRKTADAQRTLSAIHHALGDAFRTFTQNLPPIARSSRADFLAAAEGARPLFSVPLIDVVPNVGRAVGDLIRAVHTEEIEELGLFAQLRKRLEMNVHDASDVPYPAPTHKLVLPESHKGTPQEIVHLYLRDTPFEYLFDAQVPFAFTDERRFEHMHVIGGTGHGKTQLLQHLIHHDVTRADPPSLIVLDSQGDMLRKIEKLAVFTRESVRDRLVLIDPEDVEYPVALNMFDMSNARLSGYSLAHREQIEAGVIELYNYVFGALAAELTQKQGTAFAYVSRLMLSIPGATIHTLRQLMEDDAPSVEKSPFAAQIGKLDSTSRAFFQNQFFSKAFAQTKQQIARRLYGVLQVPAFDRMFSSPTNKLDMFAAMQAGKVVLINTSKALLKSDASALFGRYMIALAMKAAFERVAVAQRNAAFLIVDEAAEYFDENLETLLSQARKFNLGVLFAHQHLDQLTPAMRSSVAANTSIKLAGGVSDRDARALAPDMRTTAEFITSMKKHAHSTEFACYVRNVTANAVRLRVPFGTMESAPKMEKADHARLIAQNRARYAATPAGAGAAHAPAQSSAPPQTPQRVDPDTVSSDAAPKW